MSQHEFTSARVGALASALLSNPLSTPQEKSVAGSALTQRPAHWQNKLGALAGLGREIEMRDRIFELMTSCHPRAPTREEMLALYDR
jgi:hypothetical protein